MYAKLPDDKVELYQWDTGRYMLVSDDVDRIDFLFRNTRNIVYGVFSEDGIVPIPDVILQTAGVMDALIMFDNDGVSTVERMEIPVIERPMPPGYVMTERGTIVTYDDLDQVLGKFDLMKVTGGTMKGDIDMNGYMVTGLDDAEEDGDAVSKHYADLRYVQLSGGTMRGRLRGFSEPVNSDEPATKAYADSKASDSLNDAKTYTNNGFWTGTATISRSAWSGSTAPYTNNVSVSGLVANGTVFVDMIASSTFATAEKQAESYGHIYRMVAENGKIICYAKEKPEVDISIQIFKVVQR